MLFGDHFLIFQPFADQCEAVKRFLQEVPSVRRVSQHRKGRANCAGGSFLFLSRQPSKDLGVFNLARIVERLREAACAIRCCAVPLSRRCVQNFEVLGNLRSRRPCMSVR